MSEKADHAERLLKDPLLIEAFQAIRDAIHQRFEEASVDDGKILVGLKQRLQLLDSHWANLEEFFNTGKLEDWQVEQDKVSFLGDKK